VKPLIRWLEFKPKGSHPHLPDSQTMSRDMWQLVICGGGELRLRECYT
jgi:hypothetical protein